MLSGIAFQTEGEATLKARAPKAVDTKGESGLRFGLMSEVHGEDCTE